MSEQTISIDDNPVVVTCISPHAEVRFLNGVLQQRMQKVMFEDGAPVDSELSWQDVPNVTE